MEIPELPIIMHLTFFIENIMTKHNYTKTEIETVTVAVNAGVCLEDSSIANNTLSLAGKAVKAVITYNFHT